MTSITENVTGIYLGDRGVEFKTLITGILKKAKVKSQYIDILTTPESMDKYSAAFTSETVDEEHNYQVYEQLGDLTGNKFIVWYFHKKFAKLFQKLEERADMNATDAVKVAARLRINYGAKQSFSNIAKSLGFWDFISATNDVRLRKMKPLLEDVFEAFLGVTESIIDNNIREGRVMIGVGYNVVYQILESIFDDMNISLRYEDLYDAKTRLKELFDFHGERLGPMVYKDERVELISYSTVYRVHGGRYALRQDGSVNVKKILGGKYVEIGRGKAALKSDAQQNAAASAIEFLNSQGWKKPVPRLYQFLASEGKYPRPYQVSHESIKRRWGDDINAMQPTKPKTKYQSMYSSTVLAMYCRKRDISGVTTCLEMKADPNIPDVDGLKPLDLLFIGKIDKKPVKKIMKKLIEAGCDMEIHQVVFKNYYTKYKSSYFTEQIPSLVLID